VSAWKAFARGVAAVRRNPGLPALLLCANLLLAAVLAVPLSVALERDLRDTGAAETMLYGFDHDFWSRWSEQHADSFYANFSPEIFGSGFSLRNLELLTRGHLPLRLFDHGEEGAGKPLDAAILGLGGLYILLQTFLGGGALSVLRAPQGGFRLRALLQASGFYFGRLFRLMLLGLALYGLVFALNAPFARWADARAYEAVSEATALGWVAGRHLLLLAALLLVFTLLSYAKAVIVLEERRSALLALLTAVGFCLRHPLKVLAQVALVLASGFVLLGLWSTFDGAFATTGWKTQVVTLVGMQALMFGRIGLRLALLGGQLALYRTEQDLTP